MQLHEFSVFVQSQTNEPPTSVFFPACTERSARSCALPMANPIAIARVIM
jgi:hypothetical protein